MKRVYWRCNSGHYFSTGSCPWDGWNRPWTYELARAIGDMQSRNELPSIESLRSLGITQEVLNKVIIIEFGSEGKACFDGFAPQGYFLEGKYLPADKLGPDYP